MPEGHTLHRLARLHTRRYAGTTVSVSSPQGRFARAAALDGTVFDGAAAHGKHLFHDHGPVGTVHVHLGLYGTFTEAALPQAAPVGQVRMRLVGPTHLTDLRGPIRCELLTPGEVEAVLAKLGPDPLRAEADPDQAWARISRSRRSVALLLLDQSVLAGAGNVFRAELLFRHGIAPQTRGVDLGRGRWQAMWRDLVALLHRGLATGRIDTVDTQHSPAAQGRAARRDRHGGEVYVYRRAGQPCLVCGTEIATGLRGARNLYWCPTCQRD